MRFIGFLLNCLAFTSFGFCQSVYEAKINAKRDSTNRIFADSSKSILPKNEIPSFEGLRYYQIDSSYLIRTRFTKQNGKPFQMLTSTTRLPVYKKYGKVSFKIDNVKCKLFLYQQVFSLENDSVIGDYLFCPFRDLTNRDSTYGGGRYLDFKPTDIQDKILLVDFNLSYNPYCAYNNRYSCPVPPTANTLDVRISSGIKKWHDY
jgi:uncharacterized protein